MSMSELYPSGPGTPPGLTLGDILSHRGTTGHCADCLKNPGKPCPDHRADPGYDTTDAHGGPGQ